MTRLYHWPALDHVRQPSQLPLPVITFSTNKSEQFVYPLPDNSGEEIGAHNATAAGTSLAEEHRAYSVPFVCPGLPLSAW